MLWRLIKTSGLLMLFTLQGGVSLALADSLTLGFAEFSRELNMFDSNGALGEFLRKSVTDTLVRAAPEREPNASGLKYRLALADSISVDPEKFVWSFRLRHGLIFNNGERVDGEDIVFSLKRCVEKGHLPQDTEVSSRRRNLAYGTYEDWVDVQRKSAEEQREHLLKTIDSFPLLLTKCPIIDRDTGEVFGKDLGYGSNAVSIGEYVVDDFARGKHIRLLRRYLPGRGREGAEQIVLSGFKEARQGLTALRMGTLDALYFRNSNVVTEQVKKDETLELIHCSSYDVAYRKGLTISCGEEFRAASMRYAF